MAALLAFSCVACTKETEATKKRKKVKKTKEKITTTETPDDPDDPDDPTPTPDVFDDTFRVAISLPTKDLQRWLDDGTRMKTQFEEEGYIVDLQYADNNVATQVSQIELMVDSGCDVLVVAAIDGGALRDALDKAKNANIPVIAYDRMLMDTDAVTFFVTFDNYVVGQIQGEFIVQRLNLDAEDGPFNLEIFAGDPADNNSMFFFQGAMDVLNPYIDEGKLVIRSGQTDIYDVCVAAWKTSTAQNRMDALLDSYYSDGEKVDAVLSPNDSLALGITDSLLSAGYDEDDFPIITGQDCDMANVKNIIAGYQSMSVFRDTRILADQTVDMITAIAEQQTVPVNDTVTYNNGVITVPSYLCVPIFADINNYINVLIDSGFYTEAELS